MKSVIKKFLMGFVLLAAVVGMGLAQDYIDPGTAKWINIGSLQSPFSAGGCERGWNDVYYVGMKWPAWYSRSDNHVIDRQWLVCKDFTNAGGVNFPYLGIYFTPSSINPDYGFPMSIQQSAQFETPLVEVDYAQKISDDYIDGYMNDEVSYDRKVVNTVNTYLGVEYKRTVYGFSQQYHDNYFITEYVLTNTGNTDYDEEIEIPDNQIDSLIFGMMPRYATSSEAGRIGIVSGNMTWGKFQWVSFMDNRPKFQAYNPDSLRCFWTWLGEDDQGSAVDQIGAPDGATGRFYGSSTGRITAPQFAGWAVIHADKSASDDSDDPNQPLGLAWHGGDSYPSVYGKDVEKSEDLYGMLSLTQVVGNTEDGTGKGDTIPMVGANPLREPWGDEKPYDDFEDSKKNDGGGAAGLISFGPYNLAIGDSVKIVLVEAVSGLDRHKCVEVGENYLTATDMILPDGVTSTSNVDEYKNDWVYTGRDSLFQTFKRAIKNYKSGMAIPEPPTPPTVLRVNSQGDNITMSWEPSESESDPNFGGYRVYRAMGAVDSFYYNIFDCGAGSDNADIVYEFKDRTAIRGFSYYYYVVAFSDGSINNTGEFNPTGQLESARSYTQTNQAAYLRRPQGLDMDDIRIVPNPYNLKADSRALNASQFQYPGVDGYDKVMIYNVPGKCKIRIYSERGDLVKEIDHQDGSGDQEWKLTTSSGQIIVSGIYIVYVEVTQDIHVNDDVTEEKIYSKGESIYKKMIVIR